ncbi:MAG: DUF3566 domain-containing protein [Actinomycetota bacterium]
MVVDQAGGGTKPGAATPPAATPTRAADPPAAAPTRALTREPRSAVQVRRLRRGRLAVRKIDPWAVLKFSLVFYFCMLMVLLLATAIIFAFLKAFGVIHNLDKLLSDLSFNFKITGGVIFRWFFLIGLAWTIVATAVTVFMAFLYNLIADVVGGIELLVTERE